MKHDVKNAVPQIALKQASTGIENSDTVGHVFTPRDLQTRLQISKNTLYELLHSGALKSRRIGRQYRVSEWALHEFLGHPGASRAMIGKM
jgi:excisionase family DNA binding protein